VARRSLLTLPDSRAPQDRGFGVSGFRVVLPGGEGDPVSPPWRSGSPPTFRGDFLPVPYYGPGIFPPSLARLGTQSPDQKGLTKTRADRFDPHWGLHGQRRMIGWPGVPETLLSDPWGHPPGGWEGGSRGGERSPPRVSPLPPLREPPGQGIKGPGTAGSLPRLPESSKPRKRATRFPPSPNHPRPRGTGEGVGTSSE